MRDIKFRAWDGEGKCWMPERIAYEMLVNQCRWNPELGEEYPIMQFTGLKDKNGNEIYEGDILLADDRRILKVVWHSYAASWDTDFVSDKLPSNNFNALKNENWYFRTEVIGNIYQTPELLNP